MTVIAWDGKTLAADKADTCAGYQRTVTKIYRVPSGLVGFAGDAWRALALLNWFQGDMDKASYPASQDSDDYASAFFINKDGQLLAYGRTAYPMPCEDKFNAMGAGRDYALAIMHLGLGARKAVEVACALDITCGNGIDTLELTSPCKAALTTPEKQHEQHHATPH